MTHSVSCPRNGWFKIALASTTILSGAVSLAMPAYADAALPNGAQTVAGSANVTQNGAHMTVAQSSDRAVINWQDFSIATDHTLEFIQPNADSAVLNRVLGSTSSEIAGTLLANGQVYLINPNGIAITKTGTVKVGGGFVASTLGISDDDFLAGDLNFKASTAAPAAVSNAGYISVASGGYAAFLGGTVTNSGLIAVPTGSVALGSGQEATLDLSGGDGFLQVALPVDSGLEGNWSAAQKVVHYLS